MTLQGVTQSLSTDVVQEKMRPCRGRVTFKEPLEIQNVRGGGEFKTQSCQTSSLVPWVFRTTHRVHARNARTKACISSWGGGPLKDLSSHQAEDGAADSFLSVFRGVC